MQFVKVVERSTVGGDKMTLDDERENNPIVFRQPHMTHGAAMMAAICAMQGWKAKLWQQQELCNKAVASITEVTSPAPAV